VDAFLTFGSYDFNDAIIGVLKDGECFTPDPVTVDSNYLPAAMPPADEVEEEEEGPLDGVSRAGADRIIGGIAGVNPEEIKERNIANTYMHAHNAKRELHCTTPCASLGRQLAADAQAYADTCPSGHANNLDAGENLYFAWGSAKEQDPEQIYENAVRGWYNEIDDYNYPTHSGDSEDSVIGHFTQVVWKDSTVIGCGMKTDCKSRYSTVVVCRYQPAGNYIGQNADNVMPLASTERRQSGGRASCSTSQCL